MLPESNLSFAGVGIIFCGALIPPAQSLVRIYTTLLSLPLVSSFSINERHGRSPLWLGLHLECFFNSLFAWGMVLRPAGKAGQWNLDANCYTCKYIYIWFAPRRWNLGANCYTCKYVYI